MRVLGRDRAEDCARVGLLNAAEVGRRCRGAQVGSRQFININTLCRAPAAE